MPHETPLIATIVIGLGLAFLLGAIANRFRIPPLVGYLVAGILVGPFTPGFVADQALAPQLAEIGVILLMFGVGLHFSLTDLLSVKAIALPGAIVQIAIATGMGSAIAWWLGWPPVAGLVFGLALSVASTVVLLRALQERHILETERGRIAVGWLIVEDLAMVLALVLLPALAQILHPAGETSLAGPAAEHAGPGLWAVLILTFVKVALFVALMLVVGRKLIPWLLHYVAHTGSRELFRLAVLAIALGVAFGAAKLFGVSLALGAFFAGMILSESQLSHRAAEESLPLRDAFAVLFFVSAGMLFNPISLLHDPLPVVATLFVIVIGKSLAAFLIVLAFRHPLVTALTISASLAQIGEFSFILADVGRHLGLIPAKARDLILAGAILSIMLNPLAFTVVDLLTSRFGGKPQHRETNGTVDSGAGLSATRLRDHVVLAGHGRVGSIVSAALREKGMPFLVIEDASSRIAALQEEGVEVIPAHAARKETLRAANVAGARLIILAIPNGFEAGRVVELARSGNPAIRIIARAHSDEEVDYLKRLGTDVVIMGEREIAHGMIAALDAPTAPVRAK